ncbi:hypothetical protein PGIGA_G00195390 [Pangasianodon gigas]|uniref:Uncharacterized protein n=1 Tax=Pangasianodon gigas TaxID=30993 RepID=A0ACC5XWH0_PANGG|nr:hypothetical protein [Pangasianodon gigas]
MLELPKQIKFCCSFSWQMRSAWCEFRRNNFLCTTHEKRASAVTNGSRRKIKEPSPRLHIYTHK